MGDKGTNSKIIALTTQRRMKNIGMIYNGVRTKDIIVKSTRIEADQNQDDNYSKSRNINV